MKNPDLTYLKQGLFTTFFPETPEGKEAWCEIAAHTEGTGKIFTLHLKQTLRMLRSKGYIVRKAKKPTLTDDQLLDQLGQVVGGELWANQADTTIVVSRTDKKT